MTQEKKQPKTDVIVLKDDPEHTGSFPWRAATMRDELTIASERVRLAQGTPVDELPIQERRLNQALASMRVLSEPLPGDPDTRPDWWHQSNAGLDLYTMAPISEYWVSGVALDDRFHAGREQHKDVPKTASVPEGDGRSSADSEEVVEPKVQPPSKRSKTLVSHGQGAE